MYGAKNGTIRTALISINAVLNLCAIIVLAKNAENVQCVACSSVGYCEFCLRNGTVLRFK